MPKIKIICIFRKRARHVVAICRQKTTAAAEATSPSLLFFDGYSGAVNLEFESESDIILVFSPFYYVSSKSSVDKYKCFPIAASRTEGASASIRFSIENEADSCSIDTRPGSQHYLDYIDKLTWRQSSFTSHRTSTRLLLRKVSSPWCLQDSLGARQNHHDSLGNSHTRIRLYAW